MNKIKYFLTFNFTLTFLIFSISKYSFGYDYSNFCQSSDGLNEIKANLSCRKMPSVNSCGLLGGLVSGAVGGGLISKMAINDIISKIKAKDQVDVGKIFLDNVKNSRIEVLNPTEYENQLKEQINQAKYNSGAGAIGRGSGWDSYARANQRYYEKLLTAFQKAQKNALEKSTKLYKPIIQEIDGTTYDIANSEIPEKVYQKYAQLVKEIKELIKKNPTMDVIRDLPFYIRSRWQTINNTLEFRTYLAQDISYLERELARTPGGDLQERILAKTLLSQNQITVEDGTTAVVVNSILKKTSGKMAKILGMGAGGAVGVAVGLTSEVVGGEQTGCDNLTDQYIAVDSNCKPIIEVNKNVTGFLDLDNEKQLDLMGRQEICSFYMDLHKKLFSTPSFNDLNCSAEKVILSSKTSIYTIARENQIIKSVSFRENKHDNTTLNFDTGTGELTSFDFSSGLGFSNKVLASGQISRGFEKKANDSAAALEEMKMFIPSAVWCCDHRNDRGDVSKCFREEKAKNPQSTFKIK